MVEEGLQQLGQRPGTRVLLEAEVKVSLRKDFRQLAGTP